MRKDSEKSQSHNPSWGFGTRARRIADLIKPHS